jgi:hypothetical protein
MKRFRCVFYLAMLGFIIGLGYGVQEKASPGMGSPIEVAVRVLAENRFIDSLRLEDFELLEDGSPQKIQSLCLLEKGKLIRQESAAEFQPRLDRKFYLLFQMTEYDAKIEESLNYLFQTLLSPEDSLAIVTPMKPYALTAEALKTKSRDSIAKEMRGLLRKDIQNGASEYRTLLIDLRRIVHAIAGAGGVSDAEVESDITDSSMGIEFLLPRYKNMLVKLESLRLIDENKLLSFADGLKKSDGQKFVFLFYQREFRPEISAPILNSLMQEFQERPDIQASLTELFQFYKRDLSINLERVAQEFADAGINFNFIFMDRQARSSAGITMREQSEDVFRVFTELARATGGTTDNSSNPGAGFKKTAENAVSYYLLYYTPENSRKDGTFRKLNVRIKDKNYQVSHRIGFFAR